MIASPLTKRWLASFCMDELSKFYDLEYWNLAGLAIPTYEAFDKDIISRSYVKRIDSIDELKRSLEQLPEDAVILSHIHLNEHNYELQKLIAHYQNNRVFCDFWGDYRPSSDDTGYVECLLDVLNRQKATLFKKLKIKYYRNNLALKSFVNLCRWRDSNRLSEWKSQERVRMSYELFNHYTISTTFGSHFQINLPDYETFLSIEETQTPSLVKSRYILWLDTFFPYHPIFASVNPDIDFPSLAEGYYSILNKLFERVEKVYGLEVVIAAHPVSNFKTNPFSGRDVFINQSALLVRHAEAVMMHQSHSIIWEILWNKPTCFLINKYVNYSDLLKTETETMAQAYNMPFYDMEKISDEEIKKLFVPFDAQIRNETSNKLAASNGKRNAKLLSEYIVAIHEDIVKRRGL